MIKDLQEFGNDKTSPFYHDFFMIEIRPTTKCNYNCYYCTDLHINSNPIVDLNTDNINKIIAAVKTHVNKNVHIYFCGGEPTMYPGLADFINKISVLLEGDDYVEIQSNLSRPLKWLKQFHADLKFPHRFKLSGSYHNTQNVSFPDYIRKCLFLKQVGILNVVSFGYNKQIDVTYEYTKACNIIGQEHCEIVPLILASVDQDPTKGNSTDDEIDYIYEQENMDEYGPRGHFFRKELAYKLKDGTEKDISRGEMWLTRDNNFFGYKCSIPKNKMYIDWDGGCYKCFNQQFSPIPPVFNVNDSSFDCDEYFKKSACMTCPFTTCFFDMEYKKYYQDTPDKLKEVKINRYYNTVEYKNENEI